MQAFDENDCNLLAKALDRAYSSFLASGKLNEQNVDVATSTLSRAIIERFSQGERDEYKLALYAQNAFHAFLDEVSERDLNYLMGTSSVVRTAMIGGMSR